MWKYCPTPKPSRNNLNENDSLRGVGATSLDHLMLGSTYAESEHIQRYKPACLVMALGDAETVDQKEV